MELMELAGYTTGDNGLEEKKKGEGETETRVKVRGFLVEENEEV
jgi:hypothetical protein